MTTTIPRPDGVFAITIDHVREDAAVGKTINEVERMLISRSTLAQILDDAHSHAGAAALAKLDRAIIDLHNAHLMLNIAGLADVLHPPSMLIVEGGKLTDGAVDRIKEHVVKHIKGKHNFHEILVLEGESGATKGAPPDSEQARGVERFMAPVRLDSVRIMPGLAHATVDDQARALGGPERIAVADAVTMAVEGKLGEAVRVLVTGSSLSSFQARWLVDRAAAAREATAAGFHFRGIDEHGEAELVLDVNGVEASVFVSRELLDVIAEAFDEHDVRSCIQCHDDFSIADADHCPDGFCDNCCLSAHNEPRHASLLPHVTLEHGGGWDPDAPDADAFEDPTLDLGPARPVVSADPLHPTGRCTCGGEGRCDWCAYA